MGSCGWAQNASTAGDVNAASLLHAAEIFTRRPGAKKTSSKAIDVPGAADARRIEFIVPAGGPLAAARIESVIALSEGRTLVNLSIGVAEDDPQASRIDEIVRSLELRS